MNPLHWMIQFAFGCHHRHVSRVFTIKSRTYKICRIVAANSVYRMLK